MSISSISFRLDSNWDKFPDESRERAGNHMYTFCYNVYMFINRHSNFIGNDCCKENCSKWSIPQMKMLTDILTSLNEQYAVFSYNELSGLKYVIEAYINPTNKSTGNIRFLATYLAELYIHNRDNLDYVYG